MSDGFVTVKPRNTTSSQRGKPHQRGARRGRRRPTPSKPTVHTTRVHRKPKPLNVSQSSSTSSTKLPPEYEKPIVGKSTTPEQKENKESSTDKQLDKKQTPKSWAELLSSKLPNPNPKLTSEVSVKTPAPPSRQDLIDALSRFSPLNIHLDLGITKTGLPNFSQYHCYLNSVFQALFSSKRVLNLCVTLIDFLPILTPTVRQFLLVFCYLFAEQKQGLLKHVDYPRLGQNADVIDLMTFTKLIINDQNRKQQDCHEFCNALLHKLHEEMIPFNVDDTWSTVESKNFRNIRSSNSVISQLFGGKIESKVYDSNKKPKSTIIEPFFSISLEVNQSELIDAINDFQKEIFVSDSNQFIQSKIIEFPNIWIIHLKKFNSKCEKLTNIVNIPRSFTLSNRNYSLKSLILHKGDSINFGHLITIRVDFDGKLSVANDSEISDIEFNEILFNDVVLVIYELS
ncbi:hypothetical protein P9112_013862 [Eukaryota sp. TZLM1-RC]